MRRAAIGAAISFAPLDEQLAHAAPTSSNEAKRFVPEDPFNLPRHSMKPKPPPPRGCAHGLLFPEGTAEDDADAGADAWVYKDVSLQLSRPMTRDDWNALVAKVNALKPPTHDSFGLDGATWYVESLVDGRYRVVKQWSPDREDSIRRVGTFMLNFARHTRAGATLFDDSAVY